MRHHLPGITLRALRYSRRNVRGRHPFLTVRTPADYSAALPPLLAAKERPCSLFPKQIIPGTAKTAVSARNAAISFCADRVASFGSWPCFVGKSAPTAPAGKPSPWPSRSPAPGETYSPDAKMRKTSKEERPVQQHGPLFFSLSSFFRSFLFAQFVPSAFRFRV